MLLYFVLYGHKPVAIHLTDGPHSISDFTLREILTHPGEVDEFLQNMSVPAPMVDNILNTTVNGNEVWYPIIMTSGSYIQ